MTPDAARRTAIRLLRPMIDELKRALADEREAGRTEAEFELMCDMLEAQFRPTVDPETLKAIMREIRDAARPPMPAPAALQ